MIEKIIDFVRTVSLNDFDKFMFVSRCRWQNFYHIYIRPFEKDLTLWGLWRVYRALDAYDDAEGYTELAETALQRLDQHDWFKLRMRKDELIRKYIDWQNLWLIGKWFEPLFWLIYWEGRYRYMRSFHKHWSFREWEIGIKRRKIFAKKRRLLWYKSRYQLNLDYQKYKELSRSKHERLKYYHRTFDFNNIVDPEISLDDWLERVIHPYWYKLRYDTLSVWGSSTLKRRCARFVYFMHSNVWDTSSKAKMFKLKPYYWVRSDLMVKYMKWWKKNMSQYEDWLVFQKTLTYKWYSKICGLGIIIKKTIIAGMGMGYVRYYDTYEVINKLDMFKQIKRTEHKKNRLFGLSLADSN